MAELRIVFAGTPQFALPALRALVESHCEVVGVLTQPDRPSGRGRKPTASPAKLAALAFGIPVLQPSSLKDANVMEQLASLKPDIIVVVAYGLILPQEVLTLPKLGCVNIHASLLPRWRGAAPVQRAILAGDELTGITIMRMDTGLDTGPMLLQRSVPIPANATSGTLHDCLAPLGAEALLEVLEGVSSGSVQARPQPNVGVTYATKIDKAEALIDWSENALAIDRKIRAFNPWPVAETRFANEPLRIHSARPHADIESMGSQYGTILGLREEAIMVQCGRGTLAVTSVQRPGRRPISALDFANICRIPLQRFG